MSSVKKQSMFVEVLNRMYGEMMPHVLRKVNMRLGESGAEFVARIGEEMEVVVFGGRLTLDIGVRSESNGDIPVWVVNEWDEMDEDMGGFCIHSSIDSSEAVEVFVSRAIEMSKKKN